MKNHYLFPIFFICFFTVFSQNPKAEKADELASKKNYAAEIELRKAIMVSLEDTLSDAYKEQGYKIKLALSYLTHDMGEASSLIEKAISIFESMQVQPARESIRLNLEYSYVLLPFGQPEKAWESAKKGYDLAVEMDSETDSYQKEISKLLKQFAHIKWYQQDHEAAIGYFKQSLEKTIEQYGYYSMNTAAICGFLSTVYSFIPYFNQGLKYGLQAQEIYEKIQPENKFVLFNQYADNFEMFKKYGDLEKCTALIKKITAFYEANKNHESFMRANVNFPNLNAINTIYYYRKLQYAVTIRDTVQAEHYYALFQKSIPKGNVDFSPMEQNNIVKYNLETGSLFHKVGNYKKAKKYYLRARDFSKSINYSFGVLQAYWILTTLGVEYQEWNDVVFYAEKALAHPDVEKFNRISTIKHNLAYAHFGKMEYKKALGGLTEEINGYLAAPQNINDFTILQNLIEIGDILLKIYHAQPQDQYLEKAYQAYSEGSVVFSRLYRNGKFNNQLEDFQNKISQGMLHCSNLLNKYQEKALVQIEMNNSDHLWSNFLRNQKGFLVDPLHLEDQLDSLLKEKENISTNIDLAATLTQKDSLTEKLANTKTAIASIHQKMKESEEAYYRFSHPTFQLQDFQSSMQPGEMAIRYIVADSLVFAFGITKNSLELVQLPTTKDSLYRKTNSYLSHLKNIQANYREQAGELYTVLIAPINSEKHEQVTFVTDGFLSYLPFETLIGPGGSFFVQEHSVSYASSLELWSIQKNLDNKTQTNMGVFSPEYEPMLAANFNDSLVNTLVRAGNYELVGAKTEAKNISQLFDGTLFMAEEASKANFVENAADYDILHLAMHAVLDEKQPEKSNLIFSDNEKLYVSELYEMNIPAKLAVLSACNTGAGTIKDGEGVQSLSRAFTYAGVESTVRSLWPVPDRETSHIMTSFYQHLKDGQDKAVALRKAKQNYLENTTDQNLQHPYYWAGFVVSGDVSPIASGNPIWWYVLGGIVILGGIFFFVRKHP